MDENKAKEVTLTVNGVQVNGGEFAKIIGTSLEKISGIANNLQAIDNKIDKALKDAKVLTGEKVDGYKGDKTAIGDSQAVVRRRWYTLGIGVIDDEKTFDGIKKQLQATASVLKDVAGAQYDADQVLADVLQYQRDLANEMQYLYGIAAVNMEQCQWVAESITLRIKRASQGELNNAEIECLNNVLKTLEIQRSNFKAIGNVGEGVQANRESIAQMQVTAQAHGRAIEEQRVKGQQRDQELERQRNKDVEHDKELSRQKDKDVEHDQKLSSLERRVDSLESASVPSWVKMVVIVQTLAIIGLGILVLIK